MLGSGSDILHRGRKGIVLAILAAPVELCAEWQGRTQTDELRSDKRDLFYK